MTKKNAELRGPKNGNIHMRIDERTKFALELIGRQTGQPYTTIIESAIRERAEGLKLGVHWANLWDGDEGVRTLALIANPLYNCTPEEYAIRAFALQHKEFFYADDGAEVPQRAYVSILWPKLEHYMQTWRDKKHENFWAAAEEMGAALTRAGVKPPAYGGGAARGAERKAKK